MSEYDKAKVEEQADVITACLKLGAVDLRPLTSPPLGFACPENAPNPEPNE